MSLDRTIHLKPFIKIPIQYEEYKKEIRTCGEHENHKGDEFCPKCGKKITKQKVSDKSPLDIEELIGNDNFCELQIDDEKTMYLYSNSSSDIEIDTEENSFSLLTPELISKMISEFKEKHKEDIELLEAKIKSKVKVEFGFCYEVY